MLKIEIVNDRTANTPGNMAYPPNSEPFYIIGNYDYKIYINDELVGKGKIKNHNRLTSWPGLLSCLDKEVNGDKFRD